MSWIIIHLNKVGRTNFFIFCIYLSFLCFSQIYAYSMHIYLKINANETNSVGCCIQLIFIHIYTHLFLHFVHIWGLTYIYWYCIYGIILHIHGIQNFAYPVRQDLSCMFLHTLCRLMHIDDWRFVLIYQLHVNACMKIQCMCIAYFEEHILCKMLHFASNVLIMCTNMKKKKLHIVW